MNINIDDMMVKPLRQTTRKREQFDLRDKTAAPQQVLRQQLSARDFDDLTRDQQRMLQGAQALKASTGRAGTRRVQRDPRELASFDSTGGLYGQLQGAKEISLGSFMQQKGPTGAVSKRDVTAGLQAFQTNVGNLVGVKRVEKQDDGSNIRFNVSRDYQQTDFVFNPGTLSLQSQGWQLDIPEEYIKVDDRRFVAPTETFESFKRRTRDDRRRRTDVSTSTFTPTEIVLQEGGDKISQIIRRDVYTPFSEFRGDDRGSRDTKRQEVFTSQQQNFFEGTGFLQDKREWDSFVRRADYDYDRSTGRDFERVNRDIYLKNEFLFNPQGELTNARMYDWYYDRQFDDRNFDRGSRRETMTGKTFLRQEDTRDDDGFLTQRDVRAPFTRDREMVRVGPFRQRRELQDVDFTSRQFFDRGDLWQQQLFGISRGSGEVRDTEVLARAQDGYLRRLGSVFSFNQNNVLSTDFTDWQTTPSVTRRQVARSDLVGIDYFDPDTGELIERIR